MVLRSFNQGLDILRGTAGLHRTEFSTPGYEMNIVSSLPQAPLRRLKAKEAKHTKPGTPISQVRDPTSAPDVPPLA